MQKKLSKVPESPILLEKLLKGKVDSHEPNILTSPNAFDWDKRLGASGSSPNAFALSLHGGGQLFDYPTLPQESPNLSSERMILLNEEIGKSLAGQEHNFSLLVNQLNENYSETNSDCSMSAPRLINPVQPKQIIHNRKDSHRESERRRRESFKNAMSHLENLVILTLNRSGNCKILGKGPKRKLAHAEIYRMAHDIILTLKEEIEKVEEMNNEISSKLNSN